MHIPGSFEPDRSILHHFIDFYLGGSGDTLKRAISAVHFVIFKPLVIEANVLTNLIESIGRELIVQSRISNPDVTVFNDLVFPQSWVLDIVSRIPRPRQDIPQMQLFLDVLYKALENISVHEPGSGNKRMFGFHEPLDKLLRTVLILRM
ncbi:TPR and ankyrin repeat-containing protein 1 [Ceratobasidium sp. AG-Ba]|nr:TPR and ankyrin repeat-containing protein 1 [Ceratobasidium sp. AG-Ba]